MRRIPSFRDVARRLSVSAPVRSFDADTIAYDGAAGEGLTLYLQSLVQDTALQIRLSGPTAAVLVDDIF